MTMTGRNMSELPEGIMHHTLPRLKKRDELQLDATCRAWHAAWCTRPHLRFDDVDFSPENLERNELTLLRYRNEKIGIHTLIIKIGEDWELDVQLDIVERFNQWIQTAVENGVKKIAYLPNITHQGCLLLPPVIFQAESLNELEIEGCMGDELKLPEIENIRSYNFKRLLLTLFRFDEQAFEKLVSSCPLIEDLEIHWCTGFDKLKVTGLEKLKRFELSLHMGCRVEVQSSSLEDFDWEAGFEEDSMLTLHACPNLKVLTLSSIFITKEFFSNFGLKFPQLEYLTFYTCNHLPRTIILSQSVKKLTMYPNMDLEEIEIDVPSLESFTFAKIDTDTPQFIIKAASAHCTYEINGKLVPSL